MPIYEYQCGSCGATVEAIQKFSDPPLTQCEKCAGPLSKLVSRTSFQLKGTGWYATDYKKTTHKPETKSDTKTEAKPEAKTEAIPEAKAKAKVAPGGAKPGSEP
jgi:putative FmdB family regulatory protein